MPENSQRPTQALVCAPRVRAQDPLGATRILNQEFDGLNGGGHVLPVPESEGDSRWERTITHLAGLPVDLAAHGWRLTGVRSRAGRASSRARKGLNDLLQLTADDAEDTPMGARSVMVVGPATLARHLALPSGEPLASDHGACEDVAQAWAEGMGYLAARLSTLPGAAAVIRVDEPELETALSGEWTSSSGYRRLAPLEEPWWRLRMEDMVSIVHRHVSGAHVWVPAPCEPGPAAVRSSETSGSAQLIRGATAYHLDQWPQDEHQIERSIEFLESFAAAFSTRGLASPSLVLPVPKAHLAGKQTQPTASARALMAPMTNTGLAASSFTGTVLDHSVGRTTPADQVTVGRAASRLIALSHAIHDLTLG